jgi:hypothetical protein
MYFGQKFEPPSGKVLHGAGQSPEQFRKYWDAVGNYKPAIYMMHVRINEVKDKLPGKFDKMKLINSSLSPQIGLNLKIKEKGSQCLEVSKGQYDKEISALIKILKDYKKPVFLRIGYEFNYPKHNYNPEEFILAWKHIVDSFRKEKCNNVAFVWCACTAFDSAAKSIARIMNYYPGDDYVDWFGDDIFGVKFFKDNKDVTVETFAKESEKHKKPLMIGESSPARVGVDKGKKSWEEWFKPYFKWIKDHSVVKAFCYIDWDWGKDWKMPEWLNGRIEENEEVRKRYVKELSKDRYLHLEKKFLA